MDKILLIGMMTLMLFAAGCSKTQYSGDGTLSGKIVIGPLCPVERIPPDPNCQPNADTYKAWPITVWTSDMKVQKGLIAPALNGSYSMNLSGGRYTLVLDKSSSIGYDNLPANVTIYPGNTTIFDIIIDTGIR